MQKTSNYGLNKPESTDFYNVDDMNENMDKIDKELKEHTHNYAGSSSVGGSATSADKLSTTRKIGNASFDGTKDISVSKIQGYAAVTGGSVGYYCAVATITFKETYKRCCGILSVCDVDTNKVAGFLYFYAYAGSSVNNITGKVYWISCNNSKYYDSFILGYKGTSSQSIVNIIHKKVENGTRIIVNLIASENAELISLNNSASYMTSSSFSNYTKITSYLSSGVVPVADRLSNTSAIGSELQPVYFNDEGVPVPCNNFAEYEEGTWTPVVEPMYDSDVSGIVVVPMADYHRYTRIGNTVKVTFALSFMGTPPNFKISKNSLPFQIAQGFGKGVTSVIAHSLDVGGYVSHDGMMCLNHLKDNSGIYNAKSHGSGLDNYSNDAVLFIAEYDI